MPLRARRSRSRRDDLQAGDVKKPERHPVAIALRRQSGVDDARVSKREVLTADCNRTVSTSSDVSIFFSPDAMNMRFLPAAASKRSGYGRNRTIFDWRIRHSRDRVPKLDAARGSSDFYLDSRDGIKRGRLTYEFV
jgi:hypothetical protein